MTKLTNSAGDQTITFPTFFYWRSEVFSLLMLKFMTITTIQTLQVAVHDSVNG